MDSSSNDTTTIVEKLSQSTSAHPQRMLALTIIHHPRWDRIGERSLHAPGSEVRLSRSSPAFAAAGPCPGEPAPQAWPLDSPFVTRAPLLLRVGTAKLTIERGECRSSIAIDARCRTPGGVEGPELENKAVVPDAQLDAGVAIVLAGKVALWAHWVEAEPSEPASDDLLLGSSSAMRRLRRQIRRVAPHDVPVLLQGETGTGKELAASAIHAASTRYQGPFVSVNLAAITPTMAAAALFGHEKGAFTGATTSSGGYFGRADGGTLFLDEVAEANEEVQAALLRALESGEVQAVGASKSKKVDVRLLAATDADLTDRMSHGRFRLPLMMRLSGYELFLPALKKRRDDIPSLMRHFMQARLASLGKASFLERAGSTWFPLWLTLGCMHSDWPGNVRQLRNVASQWVIDYADEPAIDDDALLLLNRGSTALPTPPPEPTRGLARRSLDDVTDEELVRALERNRFRPGPAAEDLGIPRSSVYTLMERSPHVRKATDLEASTIRGALERAEGDVDQAASSLRVTARGLRLRMKALDVRE